MDGKEKSIAVLCFASRTLLRQPSHVVAGKGRLAALQRSALRRNEALQGGSEGGGGQW